MTGVQGSVCGGSGESAIAKKRLAIADIIKALSCIMIFLYHCNTILPGEWKFLTLFGQDLGNNLFFIVSGFTLAPSIDATPFERFHHWYLKRLIRILPITLIAYAVTWLWGYFSFRDPAQLFAVFIYPTLYWFITAILVFYIILFILAKLTGRKIQLSLIVILAVLFLALGDRKERLYAAGFIAMMTGYMLREIIIQGQTDAGGVPRRRKLTLAGVAVFFIMFMTGELTAIQYISKGLILFGAVLTGVCALLYGWYADERLKAGRFIRYLGDMALPLYLVQCFCSGYIGFWIGLHIDFPLSFLINFIVVWVLGTALYAVEKGIAPVLKYEKKKAVDK